MEKNKKIMWMILTLFLYAHKTRAMADEPHNSDILVTQLASEDRLTRCDAISRMTETVVGRGRQIGDEYYADKNIRAALINLFAKESKRKIEGEGDAECYSDLASLVASLKDTNAVPLLLDNIINSDVEYFLAETRDPRIIERMIKNFYREKDYPGKREVALKIMLKMHKNGALDEKNKEKVTAIFREAINENDCRFKVTAIRAIAETDDVETVPALEKIANADGCAVERKRNGKTVVRYRAREEAQKALGVMRARHKGKLPQGLPSDTTQQTKTQ